MPYSFPDKYNHQQVNAGEWSGWRYSGQVSFRSLFDTDLKP
jgi:hypothetical protein